MKLLKTYLGKFNVGEYKRFVIAEVIEWGGMI